MVAYPRYTHLDMMGNEIQNVNAQNLASAPSSPSAGRFYFNTADNTLYVYNGTAWVDALSQGDYTFQNGLELVSGTRNVQVKLATGDNAGNVTFTADSNGLAGSVDLSGKVDKLATAPTAGTYTKVTINADGLVSAGTTLSDTDIPNLSLSKITDVTATAAEVNVLDGITASTAELNILDGVTADASEINVLDGITATTAELNILDGVTVTASDINSVTSKIGLTDLSIASGSANYLTYDNTSGEFGANVDTTVTASSTNLVTSGAVESAIATALVGGVIYKGTWAITTSTTDFSGITLPVKKGYMYLVTGTGPATVDGIEWNPGDYLMVNADVAAGGSLAGKVDKIDNTEATDIVRLNATQTLTNKTIDADDNTISDLATGNFKSGVIQTSVRADGTAADTSIPTEKAVRDLVDGAVSGMVTTDGTQTLTNKTIDADDNTISDLELDNFKTGVVQTTVRAVSSAADTSVASEKAIATALATKVEKFTAQNGALTATSGVCTWTITNSIGSADVHVVIYRVADNVEVGAAVTTGASTITVKFNSSTDIAADTFKAVVIGLLNIHDGSKIPPCIY